MEEAKQICFKLNEDLHATVKSVCAMRHCTMRSWILKAMVEKLAKEEAGMVKSQPKLG